MVRHFMLCRKVTARQWPEPRPRSGLFRHTARRRGRRNGCRPDFKIFTMLVIWAEKVLKLCSMLCSSPMSANTSSNTASSDPSNAGICRPDCPMRVKSPTVFKETVFTAGVRAGDDEQVKVRSQPYTLIGTTFLRVQKRMAAVFDVDIAVSVLNFGIAAVISGWTERPSRR